MKVVDNVIDKGRDVLHIGHHDEMPERPSKLGHKHHHHTSSSLSHHSSTKYAPHRSDTLASSSSTYQGPPRPYLTRVPTVQTKYMEMLLHLDRIPRLHNILAASFGWILLAGFLVIPGTFTTFKKSEAYENASGNDASKIAAQILKAVGNVPLLYISAGLSGVGALGCIFLWFRWRRNYVWLINRIFLPTFLSSLAGVLSSVVNVYSAQDGVWSITARIAAIVTGSCGGVSLGLFLIYNFWALSGVRKQHDKELPEEYRRKQKQKRRESMVEKIKRKAHEPAIQPGSVV